MRTETNRNSPPRLPSMNEAQPHDRAREIRREVKEIRMPAGHEALMELVARSVQNGCHKHPKQNMANPRPQQCPPQQHSQHGVYDEVPDDILDLRQARRDQLWQPRSRRKEVD